MDVMDASSLDGLEALFHYFCGLAHELTPYSTFVGIEDVRKLYHSAARLVHPDKTGRNTNHEFRVLHSFSEEAIKYIVANGPILRPWVGLERALERWMTESPQAPVTVQAVLRDFDSLLWHLLDTQHTELFSFRHRHGIKRLPRTWRATAGGWWMPGTTPMPR